MTQSSCRAALVVWKFHWLLSLNSSISYHPKPRLKWESAMEFLCGTDLGTRLTSSLSVSHDVSGFSCGFWDMIWRLQLLSLGDKMLCCS